MRTRTDTQANVTTAALAGRTRRPTERSSKMNAVYVQTNDAEGNEIVAYRREADGRLAWLGAYPTGGRGTGAPHLPSQSSLVVSWDGRFVLVANAGSDDVSVLAVRADGLELLGATPSGGRAPKSIAVHEGLVYVLNTGSEPNVSAFRHAGDGSLAALEGSARPLSSNEADPAQVAFSPDGRTLVVTERGTNALSSFLIDDLGFAAGPETIVSAGATPYGFDFTSTGRLIVTEAFGGEVGAAAASSYAVAEPARISLVSGLVGSRRSEVCWAVVSADDRFAYVTNFGDGTISSYSIRPDGSIELHEPVAATTVAGEKGVRD